MDRQLAPMQCEDVAAARLEALRPGGQRSEQHFVTSELDEKPFAGITLRPNEAAYAVT
jgi:hypothetical protein